MDLPRFPFSFSFLPSDATAAEGKQAAGMLVFTSAFDLLVFNLEAISAGDRPKCAGVSGLPSDHRPHPC